jgi:type II secretory pathway component PulF
MYETEIETAVRSLTSLLEPLILLVMGGIVGFIVLAILLPIFEINQSF